VPSPSPTPVPTADPANVPSAEPTQVPSPQLAPVPSSKPVIEPSAEPTQPPTVVPTQLPNPSPTSAPTLTPQPTLIPSPSPTRLRCLPGTFTEELNFDCNFGNGLGGFVNNGSSDWIQGSSHDSSSDSTTINGPSADRTTGSGAYVYAPAVSYSAADQVFVLEASLGSSTGSLSFYYHLIGCVDSTLTLSTQGISGVWTQKWSIAGSSSGTVKDAWQIVELELESTELSLKFVAFTPAGASQSCSMALDDVYVAKLCTLCPKGQYQDNIGATACLPCVNGSYCETEGLTAATGTCAAGKYSRCERTIHSS